jgi:hypothetical protein
MYRFPPPGILTRAIPGNTYAYVQEIIVSSVVSMLHLTTYAVDVGARGALGHARRNSPVIFARMLAKIAHAYCMAEGALKGFDPLLPDIILGKVIKYPTLSAI